MVYSLSWLKNNLLNLLSHPMVIPTQKALSVSIPAIPEYLER
jgi:hypothetical protein